MIAGALGRKFELRIFIAPGERQVQVILGIKIDPPVESIIPIIVIDIQKAVVVYAGIGQAGTDPVIAAGESEAVFANIVIVTL